MRLFPLLLTSWLTALTSSAALAADDPRKASADVLYEEAKAFHGQQRFADALEKFEQSYKAYPSPNTLVAIAREEQLLERNVAAIRHLREALNQPLLSPRNVPAAKERLAELEALIGRVDVRGPAGVKVSVAGVEARLPLDEPIDVEPGRITIRGQLEGREYAAEAAPRAGAVVTVTLELVGAEAPAGAVAPPAEPEPSFWTTRRTVGVIAGGLAVVAAGVGGGFLVAREGHVSDGKDLLRSTPQPCADVSAATCSGYDAARMGVDASSAGAAVAFVASGALLATGALLIFWPEGRKETRMRVVPMAGGLSLTGTF